MIRLVDVDDLIVIAKAVEIMQYIMQEMLEDFFDIYDSDRKEDRDKIAWEFDRNRAKAGIIGDYLEIINMELSKHNITYWGNNFENLQDMEESQ